MNKPVRKPYKCADCNLDLHLVLIPINHKELKIWFCEFKCIENYKFKLDKIAELSIKN